MNAMNGVLLNIFGYDLSYLEAVAIATTLICIYLATKEKVLNFAFGLVCTFLYMVFFYQAHLYSSMTLNAIFFGFNIYGYFLWTRPKKGEANEHNELKVTACSFKVRALLLALVVVGTLGWGMGIIHLHEWMPSVFEQATRFPFVDSFVMVASIVAQYLMAKKKVESWYMWVVIDVVAAFLYGFAGYTFTAILYAILVVIACRGVLGWRKSYIAEAKVA